MRELSKSAQNIAPSATLAISARAKELNALGEDIIDLSIGEPDFDTPENIKNAAIDRIHFGNNGYTPAAGILALKLAICDKLKQDNNLAYKPEQIVISNGAKQSLFNACMAILNQGDEVLLPTPCWVSYIEMVKLAGGIPVEVPADSENNFIPTVEQLKHAITPKTKAIIINSPNNPTGAVFDKEILMQIGHLAVEHDLYIISDEIYEKIIYGKAHDSIANLDASFFDRTITINGMSKAYSMTGWRIGYSASNTQIAKLMSNLQSHFTSAPNTIAQYASVEGLKGSQESIEKMRAEFEHRRNYIVKELQTFKNFKLNTPDGAFYVFADISAYIGKKLDGITIESSSDFAGYLLEKCKVAVVPSEAFGIANHIRISYATSMENLKSIVKRFQEAGL